MTELFFILLSGALLYILFRPDGMRAFRSGGIRVKIALAGVVLMAVPGIITLADNLKSSTLPAVPPVRGGGLEGEVLVPAGDPVGIEESKAVLFRVFFAMKGVEPHPIDFWQSVVAMDRYVHFKLEGGHDLRLAMLGQGSGKEFAKIDYKFSYPLGSMSGQWGLRTGGTTLFEPDFTVHADSTEFSNVDFSVTGSLLRGGHHPVLVCICAIPIRDVSSYDAVPLADWWSEHGIKVQSLFDVRQHKPDSEYARGFMSIHWNSGYGSLILLGGTILLLFASVNRIRCLCGILIFFFVYTGAMDSFTLRIQSARLYDEDPMKAQAAMLEVAGTRMHPVSAATHLLALARSGGDEEMRSCALRCMYRVKLLDALDSMEWADSALKALASEESPSVARAAKKLLKG